MNKFFIAIPVMMIWLSGAVAHAVPGEYWEISSKMNIPGVPFAMPATTSKVCIPKGGENDPGKTSGDKNCQMSDAKTSGNKVTWKARCDHNGEIMTGVGEQTATANSYTGKMQLSGKSDGQDVSMDMAYSGKRIGGACDSEEMAAKVKAQICDTSAYSSTAAWIGGADHILTNCADQRKKLCDVVRKDAPKDAQTYVLLIQHDQQSKTASIAKECQLDMGATTKTMCKGVNGDNYQQLSAYCPAEAKIYREEKLRKECEGRSYSGKTNAETIRACMNGLNDVADGNKSGEENVSNESDKPAANNSSNGVMEGIKKLKGMFGF
jgi:hypothetical protein